MSASWAGVVNRVKYYVGWGDNTGVTWEANSNGVRQDSGLHCSDEGSSRDQLEPNSHPGSRPTFEPDEQYYVPPVVSNGGDPVYYQTFSTCSSSPARTPERERGSCPGFELLGALIQAVAGVALPVIASTVLLSSIGSILHGKRETSFELLTLYGYTVVAAFTTTFFNALAQGCKQNCKQDCEQKGEVLIKSIKNFGQIEGVIVNTVTGPIAMGYFMVQLIRSDPSLKNPDISRQNEGEFV